jgi:hypothetical protein
MRISGSDSQLWVEFGGQRHAQNVRQATADVVETDRAVYLRAGDGVDVRENAEGGSINYPMTRCP